MELLCLDIGSTWTKGALVGANGALFGTAQHPTTPPEVLVGIRAVAAELGADKVEKLACSSAGGGLRLAVVGQERLVSAEAAYRVALSAGAKVIHVFAGELDIPALKDLRDAKPDVLLLAGGTDGGDTRVLLHNAAMLARNRFRSPIVLAGNIDVRDEAVELLRAAKRVVLPTGNVLPDVGELAPGPARAAIRSIFLEHVIGGKGLSRGRRFRDLVRMVTPDAVLVGVGRLAALLAEAAEPGAVMVVDVGGATTDVYSAVAAPTGPETHAVALPADRRTVEGDIGMRWSATGVIKEAEAERLIPDEDVLALRKAAEHRAEFVDFVPVDPDGAALDMRIAGLAAILALRRHLRLVDGRLGPRGAGLLILSGGVFRHAEPARLSTVEEVLRADPVLRPILRHARVEVDRNYVLAPAGLLSDAGHPAAADRLLGSLAPRDDLQGALTPGQPEYDGFVGG